MPWAQSILAASDDRPFLQVPLIKPGKAVEPYAPPEPAAKSAQLDESIDEPSRCSSPTESSEPEAAESSAKAIADAEDELRQSALPKLPLTDGTFPRIKSVDFYDTDTEAECAESSIDDCIVEAEADMRDSILRLHASPEDSYGTAWLLACRASAVLNA